MEYFTNCDAGFLCGWWFIGAVVGLSCLVVQILFRIFKPKE